MRRRTLPVVALIITMYSAPIQPSVTRRTARVMSAKRQSLAASTSPNEVNSSVSCITISIIIQTLRQITATKRTYPTHAYFFFLGFSTGVLSSVFKASLISASASSITPSPFKSALYSVFSSSDGASSPDIPLLLSERLSIAQFSSFTQASSVSVPSCATVSGFSVFSLLLSNYFQP